MSEASEEKTDPTIEEQQAKLEAVLKEDQQATAGELVKAPPTVEELQAQAQEPEAQEQEDPRTHYLNSAKASMMELDMPVLRGLIKRAEIKPSRSQRSKEALADLLADHYTEAAFPPTGEPVKQEEAAEAPEAEAPEVAEEAPADLKFDFRAAYQGQLASNAEVVRLLDEMAGHAPTVRGFMDLSVKIKALLPRA